jgi:hypothetical protein
MSYYHEFRDFDFDIPHLEGFFDKSWHNGVSPSFERQINETQSITVWVEYLDPDRRECGGKQFLIIIHPVEDMGNNPDVLLETDSWDDVKNTVNQLFKDKSCTI